MVAMVIGSNPLFQLSLGASLQALAQASVGGGARAGRHTLPSMPALSALVDILLVDPLAALVPVDPLAAAARRKRMRAAPDAFQRGALALHLRLALHELCAGGPCVWGNGDPHVGNFATLANGVRRAGTPTPVVYDLADGDDEHPTPWAWDLARLLASLAVARPRLGRGDLRQLGAHAIARYRQVLGRAAEDDAEHGGRIFLQDLPPPLIELFDRDADPANEAAWWRERALLGKRPRLRRDDQQADAPEADAILSTLGAWPAARGKLELIDCVRRVGSGVGSLGRGRWRVLARGADGWRMLEVKERRPSEVAAVILGQPFTPHVAAPHHTVRLGRDPWQTLLSAAPWPLLVRTRDHARGVLDVAKLDDADLRTTVSLWATLIANFHLAGTRPLVTDLATYAARVADDAGRRTREVSDGAWKIASEMRAAHRIYRRATNG